MSFHMVGFFESLDQTIDNVAALRDGILTVSGDDLTVKRGYTHITAAWVGSANAERGRIVAPSLQDRILPDIQPVDDAAEPVSNGAFHDWRDGPIDVAEDDVVNVQVENDAAGAGEDVNAALWLAPGPIQPVAGKWFPIRFTVAAFAQTADVWNQERDITLTRGLPPGTYEMGGAHVVTPAGTPIGARFVFSTQPQRPGCLAYDDVNDVPAGPFRRGRMGPWGRFAHNDPPKLQMWSGSADNIAIEGVIDVRRVA